MRFPAGTGEEEGEGRCGVPQSHLFARLGSRPLLMVTDGFGVAAGPPAGPAEVPFPGIRPLTRPRAPKLGSRGAGEELFVE